jgi:hypothetical protein
MTSIVMVRKYVLTWHKELHPLRMAAAASAGNLQCGHWNESERSIESPFLVRV